MIKFSFSNWAITLDEISVQQFDDRTIDVQFEGTFPDEQYTIWKMYLKNGSNLTLVDLEKIGTGYKCTLNREHLGYSGAYYVQLIGSYFDESYVEHLRHSNKAEFVVPNSLDGNAFWNPLPTEFTDAMNMNAFMLARAYDSSVSYVKNDYTIFNQRLYKCLAPTAGVFIAENWEQVYLTDEMIIEAAAGLNNVGYTALPYNAEPSVSFDREARDLEIGLPRNMKVIHIGADEPTDPDVYVWIYQDETELDSILRIKDADGTYHGVPAIEGEPGFNPEVTIEQIYGGHSVTITDVFHPDGQTFNVMDGIAGEGVILSVNEQLPDEQGALALAAENIPTDGNSNVQAHIDDTENPHGVTYQQLGGTKPTYTATEVGAATKVVFSSTIPKTGWVTSANYAYVDIAISGILSTDTPFIDYDATGSTAAKMLADIYLWENILRAVTSDGKIRIYSRKPFDDTVKMQIMCVR